GLDPLLHQDQDRHLALAERHQDGCRVRHSDHEVRAGAMTTVAFIGLGNMGGPMAANLVKAGSTVKGFDLSAASCASATSDGVAIAASARDAVAGAEVVVTMLPAGEHVKAVWAEIIPAAAPGSLFIDSSTIDVESSRAAHKLAEAAGLLSLDAPVSGGTGGA